MNKSQELRKCREILKKHKIGDVVQDEQDIVFLLDVFQRHPNWQQKKGVGVRCIRVETKNKYFKKSFFLERIDNKKTDISFVTAINGTSPMQIIKKACRDAIKEYIIDFEKEHVFYGVTTCPITGEVLTQENTHIDHYDKTFDELCEKWIRIEGFTSTYTAIKSIKDMNIGYSFGVNSIKESFIDYHNKNTHLRAVSKKANLSELKKQLSKGYQEKITKEVNEFDL